jgi:hypothetical protein
MKQGATRAEDGSNLFLRNVVDFQRTSWSYIQGYKTLQRAEIAKLVQRLATVWTTKCLEFESRWGREILTSQCSPDRLWGPPSLLSNGYWENFPVVKRPRREADHSPPASAEVKKTRDNFTFYLIMLHNHRCENFESYYVAYLLKESTKHSGPMVNISALYL